MKKLGFTLAEILISLAIVGIVAAICIPTLGTNARKQANFATLKTTVSDFENAFSAVLIAHGADSFEDDDNHTGSNGWLNKEYTNYIKVSNGKTKNGCKYEIKTKNSGGTMKFDVNGTGKPDKDGIDQFELNFDEYGLFDIEKLNKYLGTDEKNKN